MFSPLETLKAVYLTRRPFLLNHKINIACDCRCKYCNSWQLTEDPARLLTRAEIETLLDRARAAGMVSYSVWGGEPLLRDDLPAVLAHARRLGFFTTISTNASCLAARAPELAPHTSLFAVSLDGIGPVHDRVRGVPGLFDKVVAGIEAVRTAGTRVRLFYNVNMLNADGIAEAAALARDLGASIFFMPAIPLAGHNERVLLDDATRARAFEQVLTLKRGGYPVLNLKFYARVIRDGASIKCRFPRYHIYVDHDGSLYTCDLGPKPDEKLAVWGDCRQVDLAALFDSREFRDKTRALENCQACRLSCGEIGSGSPLLQFPARAWLRLRHETFGQRRPTLGGGQRGPARGQK